MHKLNEKIGKKISNLLKFGKFYPQIKLKVVSQHDIS